MMHHVQIYSSSVDILCSSQPSKLYSCNMNENDMLNNCNDLKVCTWLSVNRHSSLFLWTEDNCITQIVQSHAIDKPDNQALLRPSVFSPYVKCYYVQDKFDGIDYFIQPPMCSTTCPVVGVLQLHKPVIVELPTTFYPTIILIVIPMQNNVLHSSECDIKRTILPMNYKLCWNIIQTKGPQSEHPHVLVLFISEIQYHTAEPPCDAAQENLLEFSSLVNVEDERINKNFPVHGAALSIILEFTCQYLLAPLLTAKHDRTVDARVCLTQAPHQQRDWSNAYKKILSIISF